MNCKRRILLLIICLLNVVDVFTQSTITLHFNNVVGNQPLLLNTAKYVNASGETFTVNLLQYYISNIQFVRNNGEAYVVPQDSCYFLIHADDSASAYCTVHIPADNYTSIKFIVGVDSLRNVSSVNKRKGVLDPSLTDMYWGWNSGYIFFKMEGASSSAPEDAAGLHKYRYHIGGFGGYQSKTINNIKDIQLNFPQAIISSNNHSTTIEINTDVAKIFDGKSTISIAQHNAVMFDAFSTTIADNYASMFSIKATKN